MNPDEANMEEAIRLLEMRLSIAEGLAQAQRSTLREMRSHLDLQWWLWIAMSAVNLVVLALLWGLTP